MHRINNSLCVKAIVSAEWTMEIWHVSSWVRRAISVGNNRTSFLFAVLALINVPHEPATNCRTAIFAAVDGVARAVYFKQRNL